MLKGIKLEDNFKTQIRKILFQGHVITEVNNLSYFIQEQPILEMLGKWKYIKQAVETAPVIPYEVLFGSNVQFTKG